MARLPGFLDPDSSIGRRLARFKRPIGSRSGVRLATFGAALSLGLIVVLSLAAMHMSSTPEFCGTCHVMTPYFDSWKLSEHNHVACVECHIPPGITAEFEKKFEALSMVARYFTGTYGTNPWAEIDDDACLRCHERRLLQGKEVVGGVIFDHTPHLTEVRRGLKLRCTSCHGQIVQGSHIAVTTSTCNLCHFKGQEPNKGLAQCRLCHETPDQVMLTEGASFDHSQVRELDMDCSHCHGSVVRGEGNVPRERCLTCHNDPEPLGEYAATELLHQKHVAEHKVDCVNCHLYIEHGTSTEVAPVETDGCNSCHGASHSPQANFYAGLGGRDVPRMPNPMFVAGVKCEGCHNASFSKAPSDELVLTTHSMEANEVSCMSCHGPSYLGIYEAWKTGVASRTAAMRRQMLSTQSALGSNEPEAWIDAKHNFALVERANGIHNVNFTYALLQKAHEQMNSARKERGLSPLSLPWPSVAAADADCMSCHSGIESQQGSYAGRGFAHAPHVTTAKLDCRTCHRPHDERAPGEVVRYDAPGCINCHHQSTQVEALDCARCHGNVLGRTVTSFRGEFSHSVHLEFGLECASCHQPHGGDPRPPRTACQDCHGGS